MNKKITTITTSLLLASIFTIGSISFTSCEKENASSTYNSFSKKGNSDIPHFKTKEDLEKTIDMASSFESIEELIKFEESQGRQSIGAIADAFYETIRPESFKDEKEVWNFFEKNSHLLDTTMTEGETSITPKFFFSAFRYVANADGMFSVGSMYYKLFKQGVVATDIDHLKELTYLTENELEKIDTSVFHYIKKTKSTTIPTNVSHKTCRPWDKYDEKANFSNDRKDWIRTEIISDYPYYAGFGFFVRMRVHVYSQHKWLGQWWAEKHTLTCSGKVAWHTKNLSTGNWDPASRTLYKKQNCFHLWIDIDEIPIIAKRHLTSMNILGSTPSLSARLKW